MFSFNTLQFGAKNKNMRSVPVDDAAAPISIGGIPNTRKKNPPATLVILAVLNEEAARVLW